MHWNPSFRRTCSSSELIEQNATTSHTPRTPKQGPRVIERLFGPLFFKGGEGEGGWLWVLLGSVKSPSFCQPSRKAQEEQSPRDLGGRNVRGIILPTAGRPCSISAKMYPGIDSETAIFGNLLGFELKFPTFAKSSCKPTPASRLASSCWDYFQNRRKIENCATAACTRGSSSTLCHQPGGVEASGCDTYNHTAKSAAEVCRT